MKNNNFECKGLVPWKKRRDLFQENDNVSGMGDQVSEFSERESPSLTGSPKFVTFMRKDETHANSLRTLNNGRGWWD